MLKSAATSKPALTMPGANNFPYGREAYHELYEIVCQEIEEKKRNLTERQEELQKLKQDGSMRSQDVAQMSQTRHNYECQIFRDGNMLSQLEQTKSDLENGLYSCRCKKCNNKDLNKNFIPWDRLKAVPTTKHCLAHVPNGY